MAHFFRLPMFGFSLLGFLLIAAILAVAVWAAFRSGESGKNKLGGLAGCAIALALVFVAGLGALGCTAVAVLNTPNEFFRHGPFKRIEAHWEESRHPAWRDTNGGEASSDEDADHGLRIRVDMAGGDVGEITRWFRDHTDEDLTYKITTEEGSEGRITHLDIWVPIPRDELEELRNDLQEDLHLRLPDSVRIEVRGEDD